MFLLTCLTLWLCLMVHAAAATLRLGDSIDVLVRVDERNKSKVEVFPGITLCVDGAVQVKRPIQLIFPNSMNTEWLRSDVLLQLEAHEGVLSTLNQKMLGDSTSAEEFSIYFKWTRCTFENDEILPLQLLFAFGSMVSIAMFITIIWFSRTKRPDKYY